MHAAGPNSDDSLPPGFESPQPTNDLKIDTSQIPLIRWKCPSHILLNPGWHIVAGEESKEIAIQNERNFGALEAIYPRASNIPPNPFVSPDVKDSSYDDSRTPLVPLIPVEEDDASDQLEEPTVDQPSNYHKYDPAKINASQVSNAPVTAIQQQPCGPTGALSSGLSAEPDVLAAASAAYTAIMQSNKQGSLVDHDLLVKILSDPAQVERLTKEYSQIRHEQSTSSSVVAPMPPGPPPQMTVSAPASFSNHMATFQNTNPAPPPLAPVPVMNRLPQGFPSVAMNLPPSPSPAMSFANAPVRPMNYYKTLIHQHGGERQEPLEKQQFGMYHQSAPPQTGTINNGMNGASMVSRDTKSRPMKLCAYFNGPRGCRNGANCAFLHDASATSRQEQQKGSKRIKLDNGIVGRN